MFGTKPFFRPLLIKEKTGFFGAHWPSLLKLSSQYCDRHRASKFVQNTCLDRHRSTSARKIWMITCSTNNDTPSFLWRAIGYGWNGPGMLLPVHETGAMIRESSCKEMTHSRIKRRRNIIDFTSFAQADQTPWFPSNIYPYGNDDTRKRAILPKRVKSSSCWW